MHTTELPELPDLPEGHTWRRPGPDDAEAILAVATDYNVPLVGFADYTLDDVRDHLADPDYDPGRDGWLVHDAAGKPHGYGWVTGNGVNNEVWADVLAVDNAISDWLFGKVLGRATELATEGGHDQAVVHHGTYRQDERLQDRLRQLGFEHTTVFNRMRIDHDGEVAAPQPPDGLVVRNDGADEDLRLTAHGIINESFSEHFGFVEWTAEKWLASWDAKSTFGWHQLFVAELDGAPVGVLMVTDQFVEDEKCGYVAELGVLASARGRGVAKHLLRLSFARDAAAGLAGTILHVDANNTTPALGLYESVGMRSVLVVDMFKKTLPTSGAA